MDIRHFCASTASVLALALTLAGCSSLKKSATTQIQAQVGEAALKEFPKMVLPSGFEGWELMGNEACQKKLSVASEGQENLHGYAFQKPSTQQRLVLMNVPNTLVKRVKAAGGSRAYLEALGKSPSVQTFEMKKSPGGMPFARLRTRVEPKPGVVSGERLNYLAIGQSSDGKNWEVSGSSSPDMLTETFYETFMDSVSLKPYSK